MLVRAKEGRLVSLRMRWSDEVAQMSEWMDGCITHMYLKLGSAFIQMHSLDTSDTKCVVLPETCTTNVKMLR